MALKVAIAVHGRFHGFDLARELLRRGHDVTLLTNYPLWAVADFGIPKNKVYSLWPHGVLSRVAWRVNEKGWCAYPEQWLHEWFGRWVASKISRESWDVVVCWSGIGKETFQVLAATRTLRICHRSSSHIRAQASLLEGEEKRVGVSLNRPSQWITVREMEEYRLADLIYVPSTFAKQTFLAEEISPEKIELIPHGVDANAFRPDPAVVEARCARILSGEPLHVLNVGSICFRKGMWDMAEVIRRVDQENFRFRFVGPVAPEASVFASDLSSLATFIPSQPQRELPAYYAWGDVFVLPTIEDGYPFVLAQAFAAAVPILTTPNGAGTDLVREGESGWVLPIRSPEAFLQRLEWCDQHRQELVSMVRRIYQDFQPRDWADVAADFESLCLVRLRNLTEKVSCNVR